MSPGSRSRIEVVDSASFSSWPAAVFVVAS